MKTEADIDKILEKLYPLVDVNEPVAGVIYDTLQWVIGNQDEDPYQQHLAEEEE